MQTETVADKTIGPDGGQVSDPFETVVLLYRRGVVTENTKFSILRGTESTGNTLTP